MLTWISENAKWVIYIFIIGIIAGLLFMDTSALQIDKRPPVGIVNGENLSNDLFDFHLRRVQSQQPGLSSEQAAQMRDEIFRSFVQQHLLQKEIANLKITASAYEMARDLRTEPPQGIDREAIFQTDGVFDFAKYEAWLSASETYNIPYMQEYENMLKTEKIPKKQLRVFINAGFQPSSLEAKYAVLNRETKFEILSAQGIVSTFEDISISQDLIDSVFKAEPDSFFVAEDLAKVNYIALPIEASAKDVEDIYIYASQLIEQIKEGADFAEIARSASDDPGSATQGGELGDYTPHGRWVAEFDSTAFALDSGEISAPVRTQFGYHIIQSLGKRIENDEEQVKARHILIAIAATPETVDSLETILNNIRDEVNAGKNVTEITKDYALDFKPSGWFKKGAEIPELGHISGLSSYAFFNPLRPKDDSKISDVLQNSKWVAIFQKVDSLSVGSRSMEFAKPKIEQSLKSTAKTDAIANYLKANLGKFAEINALDSATQTSIEKVKIDSLSASFEGYLPGLGYANSAIYKALSSAKEGEWSGPYTSDQNAVLIKILKKSVPDEATVNAAVKNELLMFWQYGASNAYSDYIRNLEADAKVVNNLDLYYRE
jgi:peptidyl-prolyl cis-trans isomerase D